MDRARTWNRREERSADLDFIGWNRRAVDDPQRLREHSPHQGQAHLQKDQKGSLGQQSQNG